MVFRVNFKIFQSPCRRVAILGAGKSVPQEPMRRSDPLYNLFHIRIHNVYLCTLNFIYLYCVFMYLHTFIQYSSTGTRNANRLNHYA